MFQEWKKRSIRAKEVERIIWFSGQKKLFREMSETEFQKQMSDAQKINDKPFGNPEKIIRRHIEERYIDTMQTFVWGGDNDNTKKDNKTIIYLHGGAYVYQPMILHFKAADHIAKSTNSRVYFPIYPKLPKYRFNDTYPLIDQLYSEILQTTAPENITMIGDSAGGGIALGFALWLKEFDLPQPKNIVLLSPWLDVTMCNKSLYKYDKKDPLLSPWGLRRMGSMWAGGEDGMLLPYVSPIYGDCKGTAKITMLVGTHELFYPEVIRFHKQLNKQKIEHNLIIAHKLNHDFAVMPIPEGRRSQRIISDIINGK